MTERLRNTGVDPKTVDIETDMFIFYTFLNSNIYIKDE